MIRARSQNFYAIWRWVTRMAVAVSDGIALLAVSVQELPCALITALLQLHDNWILISLHSAIKVLYRVY